MAQTRTAAPAVAQSRWRRQLALAPRLLTARALPRAKTTRQHRGGNTSRRDVAPGGGDEAAQGGGTNGDGDADWDEDIGTRDGGPTGDAAFDADECPPEVVTAIGLPCARLPTDEYRSGRHGLQIASSRTSRTAGLTSGSQRAHHTFFATLRPRSALR